MIKLTLPQARRVQLAALGLSGPTDQPATKADVLALIRRMGLLQIDTISVVARSPYLVLWSRLGDYDPAWLEELLAEKHLFEYWAHAACFIPIERYGLYRQRMLDLRAEERAWFRTSDEMNAAVLERVQREGALRSADFEDRRARPSNGWWDWKEEKRALEYLFLTGQLMVARRSKFQRVYDLQERVLPDWRDENLPAVRDVELALAEESVRQLGLAAGRWIHDYFRLPRSRTAELVKTLESAGRLARVEVAGLAETVYAHVGDLPALEQAARTDSAAPYTTLLSPFDPLVWDRARALAMFGFEYQIECYLPQAKRKFGYFSLPVLHDGALVGRLVPKAHRREGVFEVKQLYLEAGVEASDSLAQALAGAVRRCAAWHKTPRVLVGQCDPPAFKELLEKHLV